MASRTYSTCFLCRKMMCIKKITFRELSAPHPQPQVYFLNKTPHKKHPGLTNMKTLRLPDELQKAALTIIDGSEVPKLAERAHSLSNYLWSRKRAPDDRTLREKARKLEKALMEKAQESGTDLLEAKVKKQVLSRLRKETYHWKAINYNEELGVLYMAARLGGGFAAVMRALNEIKKRDPSFSPHSLLDFGSGLGTTVWASHSFWGDTLKEMVCVDSSGEMNSLAERLLKGGSDSDEPHIKQVYFRQFLPVSPKVQFDLVVGAFSLSELSNASEREETVLTLWRKTASYLVLVENGTNEGHQILMEARDLVLKNQDKSVFDPRRPSVFAPCPHEKPCPKLAQQKIVPCNFLQLYHPLRLKGNPDQQTEKFSYVVLSRGDTGETEVSEGGFDWARLTAPVLCKPRHVHCQMCCPSGELQRVVVTDHKHGRDVYRCARSSDWGDRTPIVPQVEDMQSDED